MSAPTDCCTCGSRETTPEASITTLTAGIEYTDTYRRCSPCGSWSLLTWKDSWAGAATTFRDDVSAERAQRSVALIAQCSSPRDAWCTCPIHKKFTRG